VTGAFGSDDVHIGSFSGTFLTKDVGVAKSISAGTVALTGADSANYLLVQPGSLTASITPRSLNVTATGIDKVYDATAVASVNLADNRIAGDGLAITSASSFTDKNAGSGKFVDVYDIAISGGDAGNYTVNGGTSARANITRANLVVSATAQDKVYDGNSTASITLSGSALAGDAVDLSFLSAAFGDKNVGSDKTVAVTGVRGSGVDAGNYNISATLAASSDITPATLTVTAVGHSKPFDNNSVAIVTLGDDRIAGDDLVLGTAGAAFADAQIGNDKPIAVRGIQLASGADRGNYMLAGDSAVTVADITGPLAAGSASTWTLPPVLPKPLPAIAPTMPEVLLDAMLPVSFGGGSIAVSGSVAGAVAEANTDNRIAVSIVRAPSPGRAGMVSVLVPHDIFWSGMAFSFPLPAAISEAVSGQAVRVTLVNGTPLPSWLRFMPLSKSFVAHGTPADALPIEVQVHIGEETWTVLITKPQAH
jgi:hypothetical protein